MTPEGVSITPPDLLAAATTILSDQTTPMTCPVDALEIARQLEEECIDRAQELAAEINGDLSYVPEEDAERILANLTPDNLEETAAQLAHLAYWFN